MRARDLATPYPSVAPDTPAEEAARLLAEEAVEGVFVQDDQGELQGLVADTTLLAFLLPQARLLLKLLTTGNGTLTAVGQIRVRK